jgi:cytidine deaminase
VSLLAAARDIREKAYAPYSNFKVGVALRSTSGAVFVGVNVENAAYPEGTCAEAGAIAAMIAAGDTEIAEVAVIADAPVPVQPCGGCRQKLKEFAASEVVVTMANLSGVELQMTVGELLPGAFTKDQLDM